MNILNFADYAKKKRVGLRIAKRCLSLRDNSILPQDLKSLSFVGNVFCTEKKHNEVSRLNGVKGLCSIIIENNLYYGKYEISLFGIKVSMENKIGFCKVMQNCIQKPVGDIETCSIEKFGVHKYKGYSASIPKGSGVYTFFVEKLKKHFSKVNNKNIEELFNSEILFTPITFTENSLQKEVIDFWSKPFNEY